MFVKKVQALNFVSYKELQMRDEDSLMQGCNLILGYNGQGKSNFLNGKSLLSQ